MRRGEMRESGHVVRVLLLLAPLLILPVAGWGRSPMPPEAMVSVMLELMARALPGGRLDFGANVVTWPDGRRERVAFAGSAGLVVQGDELFFIAAFDLPDRLNAVLAKLASSTPVSRSEAACRIIAMRFRGASTLGSATPGVPELLDYKEATPDVPGAATSCVGLGTETDLLGVQRRLDRPWPLVGVVYGSVHLTADGYTAITWAAVLDTDTMTWLNRVPIGVTHHGAGEATSEDLVSERLLPAVLRFTGESTRRTVTVPCELASCKVTPEVVLRAFP